MKKAGFLNCASAHGPLFRRLHLAAGGRVCGAFFALLLAALAPGLDAADSKEADAACRDGLALLRMAQTDHAALIPATKLLTKAAALYEALGNEQKGTEVNSYLYWAKKKFTIADAQTIKGDADIAKWLALVAKAPAGDPKIMLARAEEFAGKHPEDQLLVAIRYFEVADRFPETDEGRKAMKQSLAAMQKIGQEKMAEYKPTGTEGKAFIQSEPPGAAILLIENDAKKDTGKKTPALVDLPKGRQAVQLALKTFRIATLSLEISDTLAKPNKVGLEPLTVPVDVIFDPGWTIFVDGKPALGAGGNPLTPCTIVLPLGEHKLGLAKEGFLDIWQDTEIVEGGVKSPHGPPGNTIEIISKPVRGKGHLARTVNLLPLADPSRDVVHGSWTLDHGALVSCSNEVALLGIPYRPPAEYDFKVSFTRATGNEAVVLTLSKGIRMFCVMMAGWNNTAGGIEMINEKGVMDNPTKTPLSLHNGQRHTVVVQVRNDIIKALLDGGQFAQWKTDFTDMGIWGFWRVQDYAGLGVGSWNSSTLFHSIEIIEVTGEGKKTK